MEENVNRLVNELSSASDNELGGPQVAKYMRGVGKVIADMNHNLNDIQKDIARNIDNCKLTLSQEIHAVDKQISTANSKTLRWCVGVMVACTFSIVGAITAAVIIFLMQSSQ